MAADPAGRDRAVAAFNEAAALAAELAEKHPRHLAAPGVPETLQKLREVRDRLTRQRYLVGFLGPSQCGKSTTLNNLLGEPVSVEGNTKATTSVVTRIRRAPEYGLTLRYLCVADYQHRRNILCDWIRLPNTAGLDETRILEKLAGHNPEASATAAARPVKPDDKLYLTRFLESRRAHAGHVKAVAHEEDRDYTDRGIVLVHPAGELQPAPTMLLAEADVRFPRDTLDPDIELVDCPGLGAARSVDTVLTKDFIPKLDAALLFTRAEELFNEPLLDILGDLKREFGDRLESRVWVVVNKMDGPLRHAKLEGVQGVTSFDAIADFDTRYGLPLSQVLLGCKPIYDDAKKAGSVAREKALGKIHLEPDDEPRLAEILGKYPAMKFAFEELLKDGGVGNLRRLIRETVARSVAAQVARDAARTLPEHAEFLRGVIKEASSGRSQQEREAAIRWRNALMGQVGQTFGRSKFFEGEVRRIRDTLLTRFEASTTDEALRWQSAKSLVDEQYRIDAESTLQPLLDKETGELVRAAYAHYSDALEKQNLPALSLGAAGSPADIWVQFRRDDLQNLGWLTPVRPRLYQPELIQRLAEDNLAGVFGAAEYRQLMRSKIRTAVHQVVLAVMSRLRARLEELVREIRKVLWTPGPATA